jgi:hypothetical protein
MTTTIVRDETPRMVGTLHEWQALAARFSFRGMLADAGFRLTVTSRPFGLGSPTLVVSMNVSARDDDGPMPRQRGGLGFQSPLPLEPMTEADALRFLQCTVFDAVAHETKEGVWVDGQQLDDPHAKGR